MEQVYIERLRSLYSMMAGLPTQLVYMPAWRSTTKGSNTYTGYIGDEKLIGESVTHLMNDPQHRCGTAACALGWAAAYPEFKEAGLTTDEDGYPKFNNRIGMDAGEKFFGISYDESCQLFASDFGSNQKGVFLTRLRHLLKKKYIITEERNQELIRLEAIQAEKDKIATYVIGDQHG